MKDSENQLEDSNKLALEDELPNQNLKKYSIPDIHESSVHSKEEVIK